MTTVVFLLPVGAPHGSTVAVDFRKGSRLVVVVKLADEERVEAAARLVERAVRHPSFNRRTR